MGFLLDDLVAGARRRVADAAVQEPLAALRVRAQDSARPPSFTDALRGESVAVVAEVKRASPSRGVFAPGLNAEEQGRAFRDGGAAAVSVLTEPERFLGSLDDLVAVSALGVPTLRKDFIVDEYQVWEARAAGAAAVLLIVAALGDQQLEELLGLARSAEIDALVEVHDEVEVARALRAGAEVIGVNARDLRTFDVDRGAFARLRPLIGAGVASIAESGIRGPADLDAAAEQGASAVLVGEWLANSSDPQGAVAALVWAGKAMSAGEGRIVAAQGRAQ